ncbi:4-coumarate--CoA ligase-like 7 [Curcuma longa]|uniref:4-coumarate--CoA ligase-like 7 n=1 Tax=Curcuma longa TaxID=136217 RepID=UPI003D9E35E1
MDKRDALPLSPSSSLRSRSSGFHAPTRTFHSLRPSLPLPPAERRLNVATYAFSLLPNSPLPANPAFVDAATGDTVHFPELLSQIRSLSSSLLSRAGIARGHCVFFLAPTSLDIPPLYLALLSIGAVVSAGNPASTPREIAHLVSLSNPRVAFATSATAAKLPAGLDTILLDSPRFRSFLDGDGGEAVEEVAQSDVAIVKFSSGTTGMIKAAAMSHRNMIANVAAVHSMRIPVAERRRDGPEATLLGMPLFLGVAYTFLLIQLALGETTVLIEGRSGVKEMVQAAERYRVNSLTVAPSVVVEMARWPEPLELVALEYVTCGGAALAEAAAEQFMKRFPHVELRQSYGSSEAGMTTMMIDQEECRRLRSVGRLSPNVEAMLVDTTTGERLSVGQTGELWLRGPSIMLGYVGNEEANDATFDSSGWLKTGDLCYFDEDGFLFIVDRLKELIKCGGSQVPPAELEHLLQLLPGIAEAAVLPYPDEEAGQVPMAFVVLQPGTNLSEEEIMDFIAKQVTAYKKIRKVVFIDSIPKTPYGKIWRAELRKHEVFSCTSKP